MVASAPANGRILVVDDQQANLRVVSALLTRQHYLVGTAGDGETALAMARAETPDLVLLDMMMPRMDGFALLGELKRDPALMRLPVIFLTAAHDRDLLLRAFDSGAVDYVTKPFMPEELLARVGAHIGLKLTRDRLERVAAERQELVNLVAHDLKNPLSSVLFASDILRNDGCRPERIPRYMEMIHESSTDALNYIRRYLEAQAAHGDAASTPRSSETTGLPEVMEWLVRRYSLQYEARGLELATTPAPADAQVAMDGQVLRQVAENLVSNAMKYAPDSPLNLRVRRGAPGFMQLVVEDRGPGIAPSRQRELFQPFTRLTEQDPAGGLSSGLGLALAKQIVLGAGGDLWYEDRDGGGARFVVELPEAAAE